MDQFRVVKVKSPTSQTETPISNDLGLFHEIGSAMRLFNMAKKSKGEFSLILESKISNVWKTIDTWSNSGK